jgi:adenosine deaminase
MGVLGGIGILFYGLFMLLVLGLGIVWFYFSLRFFKQATEYYQSELNDRAKKQEQMSELLAKFDQLVDVLKVK